MITKQTVDPIRLFEFKRNPIKMTLKETIAKIVVNGNPFTLKNGLFL